MKIFTVLFSITLIVLSQNIFSQNTEIKQINPLSNRFALNFEGGATYPITDFPDNQISYIGQLSLDYFFPSSSAGVLGLRGYGYYGELEGSGIYGNISTTWPTIPACYTEIAAVGGGVTYTLSASRVFYPYVFLGADYLYFNPTDKLGNKLPLNQADIYSNTTWSGVAELGSRFFVSNSISLNLAFNYHYLLIDNIDDVPNSISNGTQDDIFFSARAGISFYFGGIKDSDNDGVRDEDDMCPDTPPGITVDMFGCPIDSDNDGISDYKDNCPETPPSVKVDLNGCPLDTDRDGVPDYLDKCTDTPTGVKVDSEGCPIDSDKDGVPDYLDKCPNTHIGTEVDKNGCPIKEKVTEPIKKTEIILNGAVSFASNKSELLPSAYPELGTVLKVMIDNPNTQWKINGYTDNTGSKKLNEALSLKRAQSVCDYFVAMGIDRARLIVDGYGSDFPIADNSTETGRALNRRVAIVLVTGDDKGALKDSNSNIKRIYNPGVERNVGKMTFTDGYLYCFQVSAWSSRKKAEAEAQNLRFLGYNAFVTMVDLPELKGIWFRVRIGPFNSLNEAKNIENEFAE